MQSPIEKILRLGRLPSSDDATVEILQPYETSLQEVRTPISDEEAIALLRIFGPDDCFGLSWALITLIETAPGWRAKGEAALEGIEGEWFNLLRERLQAGRRLGGA